MGSLNVRRRLVYAAVSAALGVTAGSADALRFGGTFDPLSFTGAYIINVDPDCLTSDGWKANAGGPINPGDSICSVVLESASAAVVSASSPPPPFPDFTGDLTFAPPFLSAEVLGVNVVGGTVALNAFDTTLLHQVSANPVEGDNFDWWIQFVSGAMPPVCDPYTVCYGGPPGVFLYQSSEPTEGFPDATAEFTSIEAIPEPGTVSLLLGALGGGYLARRRKKNAPS